jgi:hypothetical protein
MIQVAIAARSGTAGFLETMNACIRPILLKNSFSTNRENLSPVIACDARFKLGDTWKTRCHAVKPPKRSKSKSVVKIAIDCLSGQNLSLSRFRVFQQNRPKADI